MDIERLYFMPLDKLQSPKSGECIVNNYWIVHKERGACFQKRRDQWGKIPLNFSSCAPQANMSEDMAKQIMEKLYRTDEYEVVHIPVAYLGFFA